MKLQKAREEWQEILVTSDDPLKVDGYNYINALEERVKQLEKHINDVHIRPEGK